MPSRLAITLVAATLLFAVDSHAQKRRHFQPHSKIATSQKKGEIGGMAVVIDETLSVLREKPSLYADAVQRMHRGRKVTILGVAEADGVRFYRVTAPPSNFGWVQADAVFGKFRAGDEDRLARLVQASDGFDQIEVATEFFALYPDSKFRPSILLLFGDLLEETAVKLSKEANSRLHRSEMAASGAPIPSYYLNFVSLDRYRKLGVVYVFNSSTRAFHYDGGSWREIVKAYPTAPEAKEAQKRIDSLKTKMEATSTK
ncbi:MAG: SH3 domain-containing protein [Pyrinomonadaceae bacterium]